MGLARASDIIASANGFVGLSLMDKMPAFL